MFAYVGSSRDELTSLVEALTKSARCDTLAPNTRHGVHGDGWGFVLCSDLGISFYKSAKPIFERESILPATTGRIYAVFHARRASDKTTVSDASSHPFFGDTPSSFIFFAHNGAVNKEQLQDRLGFSGRGVDSELALKYVLGKDLQKATTELEDFTISNSALNLLILEMLRSGGVEVYVKHFYNRNREKSDRSKYYELEYQKLDKGKAVFSSTLNDYGFSGRPIEGSRLTNITDL